MQAVDRSTDRPPRRSVTRGIPAALALAGFTYALQAGLTDSAYARWVDPWPFAAGLRGLASLVNWSEVEKAVVILVSSWPVMSDSLRRLAGSGGVPRPQSGAAQRRAPARRPHGLEPAR